MTMNFVDFLNLGFGFTQRPQRRQRTQRVQLTVESLESGMFGKWNVDLGL